MKIYPLTSLLTLKCKGFIGFADEKFLSCLWIVTKFIFVCMSY